MRFEIGKLVVDDRSRTLACGARIIAAPPQVVRLLALLAASPGAIVAKSTLLAELWPDAAADDSVLWQLVYLARKLLAEHAAGSIETVPRRGYRLMPAAPAPVVGNPRRAPRWSSAAALLCVVGVLALLVAVRPRQAPSPPPSAMRAYRLGMYYLRLRTSASARRADEEMQVALRAAPGDPVILGGLAQAYVLEAIERQALRADYAAKAVATAQRALAHDACSSDALSAIGAARSIVLPPRSDGPQRAAIAGTFRRAIACDPRNSTARMYYGAFLLQYGDIAAADAQLQRAVDVDPTLSYADVLLAEAELKRGDAVSAIHYATEGIGFGTSDKVDALQTLGYGYTRVRAFASASRAFHRLERYAPQLAAAGAHAISSMRLPNGSSM